jgi:hypothetical protein
MPNAPSGGNRKERERTMDEVRKPSNSRKKEKRIALCFVFMVYLTTLISSSDFVGEMVG